MTKKNTAKMSPNYATWLASLEKKSPSSAKGFKRQMARCVDNPLSEGYPVQCNKKYRSAHVDDVDPIFYPHGGRIIFSFFASVVYFLRGGDHRRHSDGISDIYELEDE